MLKFLRKKGSQLGSIPGKIRYIILVTLMSALNSTINTSLNLCIHYNGDKKKLANFVELNKHLKIGNDNNTHCYNKFICNFTNINFENVCEQHLNKYFADGRNSNAILKYWLDLNSNWRLQKRGRGKYFVDESGVTYDLRTFTSTGAYFRPSIQKGGKRKFDLKKFRERCNTHNFILASVIKFPEVKFRLFNGKSLYNAYLKKKGTIPFTHYQELFDF